MLWLSLSTYYTVEWEIFEGFNICSFYNHIMHQVSMENKPVKKYALCAHTNFLMRIHKVEPANLLLNDLTPQKSPTLRNSVHF